MSQNDFYATDSQCEANLVSLETFPQPESSEGAATEALSATVASESIQTPSHFHSVILQPFSKIN